MKRLNLSEWAIRHASLVRYLMIILLIGGVWAYGKLGQKEDPEFTFKAMLVRVVWPGPAPTICSCKSPTGWKKADGAPRSGLRQSYTKPGETVLIVNLKESVAPKMWPMPGIRCAKSCLIFASNCPATFAGRFSTTNLATLFGNIYAFTGDGLGYEDLRRYVEYVKREAFRPAGRGQGGSGGRAGRKLYLTLDTARLASLGMDVQQLWQALAAQNAITPAGAIDTATDHVPVRVTGALQSVDALRNALLSANGRTFRLGDVAEVRRGYAEPLGFAMRFDGKPALGLAISMKKAAT